jgi:hypothetical protein
MAMAEEGASFQKPSAVERAFGQLLMMLVRIGLVRGHFHVLEVRGRKSGRIFSVPVDPLTLDGRLYLVCPRGRSNWVRNAMAAGEITLIQARRRRRYRVADVPAGQRAPVLKAYLDAFAAEVQRFFPIPKGSPVERFEALAADYPVLELTLLQ